jgi:hypothetical protein
LRKLGDCGWRVRVPPSHLACTPVPPAWAQIPSCREWLRAASAFPSRPSGGGGGGGGGGADWIVDGVVADAEGTPPAPRPFHAFQPAFCCLFVPFVGA